MKEVFKLRKGRGMNKISEKLFEIGKMIFPEMEVKEYWYLLKHSSRENLKRKDEHQSINLYI